MKHTHSVRFCCSAFNYRRFDYNGLSCTDVLYTLGVHTVIFFFWLQVLFICIWYTFCLQVFNQSVHTVIFFFWLQVLFICIWYTFCLQVFNQRSPRVSLLRNRWWSVMPGQSRQLLLCIDLMTNHAMTQMPSPHSREFYCQLIKNMLHLLILPKNTRQRSCLRAWNCIIYSSMLRAKGSSLSL